MAQTGQVSNEGNCLWELLDSVRVVIEDQAVSRPIDHNLTTAFALLAIPVFQACSPERDLRRRFDFSLDPRYNRGSPSSLLVSAISS